MQGVLPRDKLSQLYVARDLVLNLMDDFGQGPIETDTWRDVVGGVEGLIEGRLTCVCTENLARRFQDKNGQMGLPAADMRFHSKELRDESDVWEDVWNLSPNLRPIVLMQGSDPPRQYHIGIGVRSGYT